MSHRSPQRGLTLIELVIVGALATIVIAASVSHYQGFMSDQRLHSWSEAIASDLRAAQQISVSRRYSVIAVVESSRYTITASGAGGTPIHTIKASDLPPDVVCASCLSGVQSVLYSTLGTTSAETTIVLRSLVTDRTRQITVAAATGRVRID